MTPGSPSGDGTGGRLPSTAFDMDDVQLVQRMRSGDERAFDEFFGAYFPRLFHFAGDGLAVKTPPRTSSRRRIIARRKIGTWRGEAALEKLVKAKAK